jgi:prepilin-type N-terminal cleavage/methylation domain-containing protein
MKRRTAGFTLLEVVVVTAILALIANGVLISVFQVLRHSESSENKMTAITAVQNAGYWISLDARKAQEVTAQAFSEGRTVIISWDERLEGDTESSDGLDYAFSADGGNNWSSYYQAFRGSYPPATLSTTIPEEYLTNDFRLSFYLVDLRGGDEYLYLDDITISEVFFSENCSNFDNWDNGTQWILVSGEFRGRGSGSIEERTVTMTNSMDLGAYQGQTVRVYWDGHTYDSEGADILYYAFSGDGGQNWSQNYESFNGYIGGTPQTFGYTVPSQYVTSQFKMRLFWDANSIYNDFVYIDNIKVTIPMHTEDCSDFSDWDDGVDWSVYNGDEFRGHHQDGPDQDRYLTMDTSIDLTSSDIAGGFPLVFTWNTWSGSGGIEHEITYTITNGKLRRSHSINGGDPEVTLIAEDIDPNNTSCTFSGGRLTLTITSTTGAGPSEGTETRQYKVQTRPD